MAGRAQSLARGSAAATLRSRLENKTAQVGVIGLGYVGLPLAVEFAREGFVVTGIDLDRARVDGVNRGRSYIPDVPSDDLASLGSKGRLKATTNTKALRDLDAIIVCVPTPLRKTREPDISFILSAAEDIAACLRPGQLIVLESTTYPGTTEEVLLPKLEAKGLKVGKDFALAFSPERIDPGNTQYVTRTIPKVIGGVTPTCRQLAVLLYGKVIQTIVPVSSPRVAEMVKLLENTFRAVNIGLANEIALLCHKLNVDVWEVIDAAKTKPFGFMAFYPGPGIGGHCIPSDPMYLAWKAKAHGFEPRFIELADQTNRYMPHYVVERVAEALNHQRKPLKGSRVLLLGMAYKPDVNDMRDSPAVEVANELLERGAEVSVHDPFIPKAAVDGRELKSVPLTAALLKHTDCAVILTNHTQVDYELILKHAPAIVDTRNQYRALRHRHPQILSL